MFCANAHAAKAKEGENGGPATAAPLVVSSQSHILFPLARSGILSLPSSFLGLSHPRSGLWNNLSGRKMKMTSLFLTYELLGTKVQTSVAQVFLDVA